MVAKRKGDKMKITTIDKLDFVMECLPPIGTLNVSIPFELISFEDLKEKFEGWDLKFLKKGPKDCYNIFAVNFASTRGALWFLEKNYTKSLIGAEIGVEAGVHAKQLRKYLDIKKLYLIDIWKNYKESDNARYSSQELNLKGVIEEFGDDENMIIIQKESLKAVEMFDDGYFDFVYVDANHLYEHVKEDLRAWYPKVKKGGVFCGHDYNGGYHPGVRKAVDEFVKENKLKLYDKNFDWWIIK